MTMFAILLFLPLIIAVSGNPSGCPTNFTCLEKETCCETKNGFWSCCPIENGICCADGLHCCPKDDQCFANGTCFSSHSNDIYNAFPSRSSKNQLKSVQCPDGKSQCDDGQTCCPLESGEYACCLFANAVCCSDHVHCCPYGNTCDMEHGQCVSQISTPWFTKMTSISVKKKLTKLLQDQVIPSKQILSIESSEEEEKDENTMSIICPDKNQCADQTTCCQTETGPFGCCPYADASCCSDKIHCCPDGYSCDESGQRCIRQFHTHSQFKSMKKLLFQKEEEEDQQCPDGKSQCSPNTTCCPNKQNSSLTYSCCPYSKGVCCGLNGSVCCPNGYDCNEDQLSCQLRDENSILLRNLLSLDYPNQCGSSNIVCSNEQTCCLNSQNSYSCCPYSNGQCCSDGEHCCPSGTTCHPEMQGCL